MFWEFFLREISFDFVCNDNRFIPPFWSFQNSLPVVRNSAQGESESLEAAFKGFWTFLSEEVEFVLNYSSSDVYRGDARSWKL